MKENGDPRYLEFIGTDTDNKEDPNRITGDIDGNGSVDLIDLSTLSLALLGDISLTENQLKPADINKDNEIDLADLVTLKQYVCKAIITL